MPLVEMQQECRACFPSSTMISGIQTALWSTPQKRGFGVLLKQNIKLNAGATAQLLVSTALGVFWSSVIGGPIVIFLILNLTSSHILFKINLICFALCTKANGWN